MTDEDKMDIDIVVVSESNEVEQYCPWEGPTSVSVAMTDIDLFIDDEDEESNGLTRATYTFDNFHKAMAFVQHIRINGIVVDGVNTPDKKQPLVVYFPPNCVAKAILFPKVEGESQEPEEPNTSNDKVVTLRPR